MTEQELRSEQRKILIEVFREIAAPSLNQPHVLKALATHTLFLLNNIKTPSQVEP